MISAFASTLPQVEVSRGVPFDKTLLSQIEEEIPEVCSFSNCTEVLSNFLQYLGYQVKVKGNRILVTKSLLVKRVVFVGLPKESEELEKNVKLLLFNKPFNKTSLENVKQLLLLKLKNLGYRNARLKVEVISSVDGVEVEFIVNKGLPVVVKKVVVVSPKEFKDYLYKKFKPFEGKKLEFFSLRKLMEKVEGEFLKKSYYNVSISYRVVPLGKNTVLLKILFSPGKRYLVSFKGSRTFPSSKLAKLLTFYSSRSADEFEFRRSSERIRKFYMDNGFPFVEVKVEKEVKKNLVKVVFRIKEGKRVIVKKILPREYQGLAKELLNKPFSLSSVEKVLALLKLEMREEGFLDAAVGYHISPSGVLAFKVKRGKRYLVSEIKVYGKKVCCVSLNHLSLPLVYNGKLEDSLRSKLLKTCGDLKVKVKKNFIEENDKVLVSILMFAEPKKRKRVGFVLVKGLERTSLRWIKSSIFLKPRMLYSDDLLVEQYTKLANTGLFSFISIVDYPVNGMVNEVIYLKEGALLNLKGFVGYGTDTGYVLNGFGSSSSPLGMGVKYFLFGNYRQKEGYDAVFKLTKPYFPFKRYLTSYSIVKKEQIYESFTSDKVIYKLSFDRKASKVNFQSFGLEISRETIKNTTLEEKEKSLKRSIFFLQRYDKRDNVVNPKKGYLLQFYTSLSGEFLGGNTDFWSVEEKFLTLFPLGEKFVFAFRESSGFIQPIKGSSIPLQDRFFLGGAESVRGYKYGTISPRDDKGNYVGGNAYGLLSFELRYNFKNSFQLALFYDRGNVFEKVEDFSLNDWFSSIGVGLRYITPVGPLRIDYGYKLKRVSGQGIGRFHISFGFPF